jgi:hypothetical protein
MPDHQKAITRGAGALAVCAALAFVAAPARATVVDRGTFAGSGTVADELCGIAVVHDFAFSGDFRNRANKASDGQAFFERLNFDSRDVFTNPANGRSMSIEDHHLYNEVKARLIAGNVYEFTAIEAGQPFTVRDATGKVVLRDRGVLRHRFLFDTLGDGMPGGITLDDQIVGIGGPHPGLDQSEEEFCAMVDSLLG